VLLSKILYIIGQLPIKDYMADHQCTGVILAGGRNTRFGGHNKAFIRIGKRLIIDRILDALKGRVGEIIVITNDPSTYLDWNFPLYSDHYSIRSSLNGIHAGLFYASHPHAFFCACDTPFPQPELIAYLIDRIEPRVDVVIPQTSMGMEPLFAVYSKSCLRHVTAQLEAERLKITNFFKAVGVVKLKEEEMRRHDPNLLSFFNINTPQDRETAEAMVLRGEAI
jgi:molybdopterin-guanine dinucleotide biosynthesis protein A